jgi:hypothetical protein
MSLLPTPEMRIISMMIRAWNISPNPLSDANMPRASRGQPRRDRAREKTMLAFVIKELFGGGQHQESPKVKPTLRVT